MRKSNKKCFFFLRLKLKRCFKYRVKQTYKEHYTTMHLDTEQYIILNVYIIIATRFYYNLLKLLRVKLLFTNCMYVCIHFLNRIITDNFTNT